MTFFYNIFKFYNLLFILINSVSAVQNSREIIWPEISHYKDYIIILKEKTSDSLIDIHHSSCNEFIFSHQKDFLSGRKLSFYSNNEVKSISQPEDNYPKFEGTLPKNSFLWSCAVDGTGYKRNYYRYYSKENINEPYLIGEDFSKIIFNESTAVILAGIKTRYDEMCEYWVNTKNKGWIMIETFPDLHLFSPIFYYIATNSRFISLISKEGRIDIDLINGDKTIKDDAEFNTEIWKQTMPENYVARNEDYWYFSYTKEGETHWSGSLFFKKDYFELLKKISFQLKCEQFWLPSLSAFLESSWRFTVAINNLLEMDGKYFPAKNEFTLENNEESSPLSTLLFPEKIYQSFTSKTSDGLADLQIPYFLSLPQSGKAPYPTILAVHGGPHRQDLKSSTYNELHFTQKGYAVLQINFRGSTTNRQLYCEGYGQIGRLMQHDLYRIVEHLILKGTIDPNNIAIFGASYGGYSTLLAATHCEEYVSSTFPGFKCAISFFGPTCLETSIKEDSISYGKGYPPYFIRKILPNIYNDWIINPNHLKKLQDISPLYRANKLSIPLLLMHGENDVTVSEYHSRAFSQKLVESNINHTYVTFKEAHGWRKTANNYASACLIEEFLGTYLKGGTMDAPTLKDIKDTDIYFVYGAHNFPIYLKAFNRISLQNNN